MTNRQIKFSDIGDFLGDKGILVGQGVKLHFVATLRLIFQVHGAISVHRMRFASHVCDQRSFAGRYNSPVTDDQHFRRFIFAVFSIDYFGLIIYLLMNFDLLLFISLPLYSIHLGAIITIINTSTLLVKTCDHQLIWVIVLAFIHFQQETSFQALISIWFSICLYIFLIEM